MSSEDLAPSLRREFVVSCELETDAGKIYTRRWLQSLRRRSCWWAPDHGACVSPPSLVLVDACMTTDVYIAFLPLPTYYKLVLRAALV